MTDIAINIVFGPERPNAARRAVEAVRACKERLAASSPFLPEQYDRLLKALRAAEVVRAQYYEYGDSLFGGLDGAGGNRGQSFATLGDVRRHVEGMA